MKKNECPEWYRPRGYLHFDLPVSAKQAMRIASSPASVAQHSFYPLISYTVSAIKVRRDPATGIIGTKQHKPRPIKYASHVDAHIYSYYANLLNRAYEQHVLLCDLNECVLAFRALGRSNVDFALKAFSIIRKLGDCTALAFDVSGFFDTIDHRLLKKTWLTVLGGQTLPPDHYSVYKSVTKYSHVDRGSLYQTLGISENNPKNGRTRVCTPQEFRDKVRGGKLVQRNVESFGIPQGTPISAVLSNIYLLNFDVVIRDEAEKRGGVYLRYCDDILLIVPTSQEAGLAACVESEISKLNLTINIKKTETSRFKARPGAQRADRTLQYLGFTFDGERILLRSSALARFSARMNKGVRLAKATARSRNTKRLKNGKPAQALFKNKLYERYSHLGHRNFIRYGLNAAEKLNSKAIKRQLRPLWSRLAAAIEKT